MPQRRWIHAKNNIQPSSLTWGPASAILLNIVIALNQSVFGTGYPPATDIDVTCLTIFLHSLAESIPLLVHPDCYCPLFQAIKMRRILTAKSGSDATHPWPTKIRHVTSVAV